MSTSSSSSSLRENRSPAPSEKDFRTSVLSSLNQRTSGGALDGTTAASPYMSSGQRLQSETSPSRNKKPAVRSQDVDASFEVLQAPPPPVRRSSSLESSTASCQPALVFAKPLVRRRSTLFDSLPGRSRAGSLMTVPETKASPPSFFQRLSQNSTLLGGDLSTNLSNDGDGDGNEDDDGDGDGDGVVHDKHSSSSSSSSHLKAGAKRPAHPRVSLFGAVMEKLNAPPGTPQQNKATKTGQHKSTSLLSPSGKSIMNIVNQFVMSPFRFSSPNKAKRRLLSSPTTSRDSGAATAAATATSATMTVTEGTQSTPQRKRPRIDSSTLATPSPRKQSSANEDSMSSLHDDDNWREAPIHNGQAEILDWALSKKWQLECHPPEALLGIVHTREWRDAVGYWEYTPNSDVVIASSKDSDGSNMNSAPVKKSLTDNITAVKGVEGISKLESGNTKPTDPAVELAKLLVKTVRSSSSLSSSQGKPNCSNTSRPTLVADGKQKNNMTHLTSSQEQRREWKQSLRSLFYQWCQRLEAAENFRTAILDYYFYCVSDDHVVLFRVDATEHHYLPRVLVSSCGESFLQRLRDTGVDTIKVLDDPTTRADPDPDNDTEKQRLMSPTVKADLEALRKAQAYGEVAGADVSIKIKTKTKEIKPTTQPKDLPITVSGHDDVASFFEVYLNRLGRVKDIHVDNTLPQSFPKLVSPQSMGPFWHSSLKSLEIRPVKPSKEARGTSGIVEIQGSVVLPSMIRKIVSLSASKLSVLHSNSSGLTDAAPLTIRSPSREDPTATKAGSHYVVLHAVEEEETIVKTTKAAFRADPSVEKKKRIGHASILFNDIDNNSVLDGGKEAVVLHDRKLPECRSGTTLQLVVWDVSRSNVAACKVGTIL